jgi:hypothetical protein
MYVSEKLRDLAEEQALRDTRRPPPPKKKPVGGPMARRAGGTLQRIGERLEAWGSVLPATTETDTAC